MRLEANDIYFRYGKGKWLLSGRSLQVNSGEIVGLSGPSGCGKTTLARIIAGYEQPHAGTVSLDNKPLPQKGYNPVQLVFQHPEQAVNPRWRMRQVLEEAWSIDEATLEALGIETSWLDRWPNELSGGELQRFCVARALGPNTRFLIADEMTTMLDAITQAQLWHYVLDVAQKRKLGVIVVSHERALMNRLCDRIVELEV